ncbi:hypothetical protein EK21DRAFT_83512 [Setomelanomma holmii]|uniref:BZIP domain-containing protein n=1 Tax=Setomelanomma holmii TaxID=210430 RepID=A0A9P4LTD1_9PLEO|nr:hypothetical protein EK21DRAFT_83512 [Setomelanomma holmii]
MPASRSKSSKTPESVPSQGDPDRKRVLNVLAQRRYRQKRRERIAALEAEASRSTSSQDDQVTHPHEPSLDAQHSDPDAPEPIQMYTETVEEVTYDFPEALPSLDFDHDPFDLSLMEFTQLPSPLPSIPSPQPLQLSLPLDGAVLSIPILGAIRAFASIAMAFDVAAHVWDPSYLHVLSPNMPAVTSLPANLHPVPAQLTIPHHPLLDCLPWPTVREKLICMLSMPSAFRPPVAKEEEDGAEPCWSLPSFAASPRSASIDSGIKQSTAIVQLVQDLDDLKDGGGVRVHGNTTTWCEGNELTEEAWEIGAAFYRKWWWCLDQRIVELSNRRRRERGLPRLKMIR